MQKTELKNIFRFKNGIALKPKNFFTRGFFPFGSENWPQYLILYLITLISLQCEFFCAILTALCSIWYKNLMIMFKNLNFCRAPDFRSNFYLNFEFLMKKIVIMPQDAAIFIGTIWKRRKFPTTSFKDLFWTFLDLGVMIF